MPDTQEMIHDIYAVSATRQATIFGVNKFAA